MADVIVDEQNNAVSVTSASSATVVVSDTFIVPIGSLSDVSVSSPSSGEVLAYNASTSSWENSSAGVGDMLKYVYDSDNDGVVNNSALLEGSSLAEVLAAGGGSMNDVVDDTSPTLGGDLDANNKTIDNAETVQFNSEIDNSLVDSSATITWNNGQKQKVTLSANTITLILANPTSVGNFLLKVVNGGLANLTWSTSSGSIYWAGGTAPTLTSSGTDIISFYYDGTNFYGVASLAFS